MQQTIDAAKTISYPPLLKRIQSILIDQVLIIFSMYLISVIINKAGGAPDWFRLALFGVLWFLYEPLAMTLGATLGNYLMGIRVRKNSDPSQKINIFQAYIRLIFKGLFGILSFIIMHFNEKRRAIHDMVSDTIMIEL